ncbi:hypothetical protein NE237_025355 [Protea cynaroides]|uniref:Uncharacterized protein n=1 Tax=Protea cynaroides TaxID=273540 RepID=A0A9Q0H2Z5_9MAGN|nr:hypothetical protein NE237_025355 [Protea cynaroides]
MSSSPKGEESRLFPSEENKNDGYLGLLVEAARLISGNFEDEESEPKTSSEKAKTETNEQVGCRSKRNRFWMFELYDGFEDISPVVRSKRGRNQYSIQNDDDDDMNAEAEAAVAEASLVFNPS